MILRQSPKGQVGCPFLRAGPLLLCLCALFALADPLWACSHCHQGIESIATGEMAERIARLGRRHQDPGGCVVCHGGDPTAEDQVDAHRGAPSGLTSEGGPDAFYPDPGDARIAHRACGQCHEGYVERWRKSAKGTHAEGIERDQCDAAWQRRVLSGDAAMRFGRYAVVDEDGPEPAVGTPAYKSLMRRLAEQRPGDFPPRLLGVPEIPPGFPPDDAAESCGACHGEGAGSGVRSSCSACHMVYGEYQGRDPMIPRTKPETIVFHRIRGAGTSRAVRADGSEERLAGIPLETCFQCHYDPRLTGINGMGDAHVHYGRGHGTPGDALLCQDCHTSIEMHGDGNITARGAAQIEIRCQDCHGTTAYFPWELPLNFADPEGSEVDLAGSRGTARPDQGSGSLPAHDGFVLTSRGNPFGNVVRVGDEVRLYSASGGVHRVKLLKAIADSGSWQSELSRQVKAFPVNHGAMDCNDCHADWLPPCLGCHDQGAAQQPGGLIPR